MAGRLLRGGLAGLAAGAFVFAGIPALLYGIINQGVWVLLGLGAVCLGELALLGHPQKRVAAWESFAGRGHCRRLLGRLLGVLLVLFILGTSALSGLMLRWGWCNRPHPAAQTTAVVLGCLVEGDQPSKMLKNRLEKALVYLNEHPEAQVIVTGGQGKRERRTEAGVQAQWLLQRGIAPHRILVEDRSLDTAENMKNTAAMLRENNLPPEAVLFTDGFHQLRSRFYAKVNGVAATGISSHTPWGLLPAYWLREQLALCEAALHYPAWVFR